MNPVEKMKIKKNHEKSVCDRFFNIYDPSFKFKRLGDDKRETDCFYQKSDITIGCEVTMVYYDNSDGKDEWSVARGERRPEPIELRSGGTIWSPDDLFLERLKARLKSKVGKKYIGGDYNFLILDGRRLVLDGNEAKEILKNLKVEEKGDFRSIFFIMPEANVSPSYDVCIEIA